MVKDRDLYSAKTKEQTFIHNTVKLKDERVRLTKTMGW